MRGLRVGCYVAAGVAFGYAATTLYETGERVMVLGLLAALLPTLWAEVDR